MHIPPLPNSIDTINPRQWQTFQPYAEELQQRPFSPGTITQWLTDWSALYALIHEAGSMLYVKKTINTADAEAEQAYLDFITNVQPQWSIADQALKERLLAFDGADEAMAAMEPSMALVLHAMRDAADLFRDENVPLQTELGKMDNAYDKITGGLTAVFDNEEKNLSQLRALLQNKDRNLRQRAWTVMMALWGSKRSELDKLYRDMLGVRRQVAENAGLADYRAYVFREYGRFSYTPADCFTFHEAIETAVVPAASRIYAKKKAQLALDKLRPWDVTVETSDAPALTPYDGQNDLIQHSINIFHQVDPELGRYVSTMAEEELLDLDTRAGKALGGYCIDLPVRKRPFIFMNGTGQHDDVQTMLHESGHAFHVFETADLPFVWQQNPPMEFCEVASMSMELLTAPYFVQDKGGFYTPADAARARIEHLEGLITFLPYMAVVDAFQHWVYTNPDAAMDSANCDHAWDELWSRFMPDVQWDGLDDVRVTGWHRKPHIFGSPFYYIEYGMAQVGAMQVWRNSLTDPDGALTAYRQALSLGSTKTLPDLFAAAGAEFRFDTDMLTGLVELVEQTIAELEQVGE